MASEFGEGFQRQPGHIAAFSPLDRARDARRRVTIVKNEINTIREDMARNQARIDDGLSGMTSTLRNMGRSTDNSSLLFLNCRRAARDPKLISVSNS